MNRKTPRQILDLFKFLMFVLLFIFIGTVTALAKSKNSSDKTSSSLKSETNENPSLQVAYFAGGCFWCTESDFEKMNGVTDVISGYSGGDVENPTYDQVSRGNTGHIESVKVTFKSGSIDYKTLVQKFLLTVDVTDNKGQFVDRGPQYRPALFYKSQEEKKIIDEVLSELQKIKPFKKDVVIDLLEFKNFYDAEKYHQDYYKKSKFKYSYYRTASGRDKTLKKLWGDFKFNSNVKSSSSTPNSETSNKTLGRKKMSWENFKKPSPEELKKILSEEQFKVTQKEGTEKPFSNAYNDNKQEGIYVDIVSGEPLFSSKDKYDSGTGWPSFSKPIDDKFIKTKTDYKLLYPRTEVRSKYADSHLGHVFKDGPKPTGLRYCMNSASMRFIPKDKMKEEGYEDYLKYLD
jgi:peptide methionine sulfoxide reductase msrA/msrB